MPGSGVKKRQQMLAISAYNLRREGKTYRQIAKFLGIPVEVVANRISVGERLSSLKEPEQINHD